MWSKLNCTLGNRGGREGDSEGTPVNILTKGRSGILDSSIPSYRSIMTPSVNTRALMALKVTFHTSLWVVSRLSTQGQRSIKSRKSFVRQCLQEFPAP